MSIVSTRTRSWLFTPATRPERFPKATMAGAEPLASRKWYWFDIGAILLAGIVVVIGTAAGHRDAPNFADTIIRICTAPFREASAEEAPFLSENVGAMTRMMADMEIMPSGDVDADFAAMMIPHHQGAIDMAQAELRHGRNEQLRRIAQEIIVTQQQEIAAMRLAVGQPLPPSAAAPDQPSDLSAGAPHPTSTPKKER